MRIKLLVIPIICLILISFQDNVFGESDEGIFPDWVREIIVVWINGGITDSEFLVLVENILEEKIIPDEIESDKQLKYTAKNLLDEVAPIEEESFEKIPGWAKDRATWWVEGKITDEQFLRTIHYLREVGYVEYDPETSIFSINESQDAGLEKFLLTEKEILKITKQTKWRFISTEYEFEEREGVVDSVKIMLKDVTRVYEPMYYKFKVPSMVMQISEFNNESDLNSFWNSYRNQDDKTIFESAYLAGEPNKDSKCFFNYTSEGGMTSCIVENMIIQVIIYDIHNEHFSYNTKDLTLNENEPTSRFVSEILKKISNYKNIHLESKLHEILEKNIVDEQKTENNNELREFEKDRIQGVSNFSCSKDDFGLITISGQYNNDNTKRNEVKISVWFYDNKGNIIGETGTIMKNLEEYETKRFLGHTKWNENFSNCQVAIN